jgi:hypothetical protein
MSDVQVTGPMHSSNLEGRLASPILRFRVQANFQSALRAGGRRGTCRLRRAGDSESESPSRIAAAPSPVSPAPPATAASDSASPSRALGLATGMDGERGGPRAGPELRVGASGPRRARGLSAARAGGPGVANDGPCCHCQWHCVDDCELGAAVASLSQVAGRFLMMTQLRSGHAGPCQWETTRRQAPSQGAPRIIVIIVAFIVHNGPRMPGPQRHCQRRGVDAVAC